jgi:hypothetical protein
MWEPDDNHCQELRRSVELAINVYDQCSDEDKEYLAARLNARYVSTKEAHHTHGVDIS